ncbi:hypothetical protein R50071_47150 [Halioxenophilus aromaticivorans]
MPASPWLQASSDKNTLNPRQQAIIPIAAFTATGDLQRLEPALHQGLEHGLTVNEIKEIFIHSYAYVGFPRALNGINTFINVMDERQNNGLKDTTGKQASPLPDNYDAIEYGHQTRNALVGRDISNRTTGYAPFVPTIDNFLVRHLFADIFVRDIFSHKDRELITISMLAAMTGTDPQLRGHLGISLRVGFTAEQLGEFIQILNNQVSSVSAQRAFALLKQHNPTGLKPLPSAPLTVAKPGEATIAPADRFTGTARISFRFSSPEDGDFAGGLVEFEAGSRTAWHTHPKGQTLIVVSGTGWVQSEHGDIQTVSKGDVVTIPANTKHWHGATDKTAMTHVAIATSLAGTRVTWLEKVSLNPTDIKNPQ